MTTTTRLAVYTTEHLCGLAVVCLEARPARWFSPWMRFLAAGFTRQLRQDLMAREPVGDERSDNGIGRRIRGP